MSKIELPTKTHQNWFVSASTAYFADSGEEFIALGTSNGIIFRVKVGPGQSSFQKEPGFTNGVENSFLCMASCPKSKTLASIKKEGILPCSLKKFYDFLNQENNKELKAKVESCRKIGIQNIVDHLLDVYQADINSETLDPNLISWIREKTKFITWIASKSTDLYSDKKDLTLNKNTTNNIVVSWLDSPELEQKYTQYEKISEDKKEIIEQ